MLAPVLAPQPYSYIAPEIDTHIAKERVNLDLVNLTPGESYFPLMASSTSVIGSVLGYYGTSNGTVYGFGLGGTASTPLNSTFSLMHVSVSANNDMLQPVLASFSNYTAFVSQSKLELQNFIVIATANGTVNIGMVKWTQGITGDGTPYVNKISSITVNGSIVTRPVSNTQDISTTVPVYVPFFGTTSPPIGSIASIYVVSENQTGYYLNSISVDPMGLNWCVKLQGDQQPLTPVYYGSFFRNAITSNTARILVTQGSSVYMYSAGNGALANTVSFNSTVVTAPYIAEDYQYQLNPYNAFFTSTKNNAVYLVNLSSFGKTELLSTNTTVSAIASSLGSTGFPTYLLVQTSEHVYIATESNNTYSITKVLLPQNHGGYFLQPKYDQSAGTFIIVSSEGLMFSLQGGIGQYPYTWSVSLSPKPSNVTEPDAFVDSNTGRIEIGVISAEGRLYVYDATAYNMNPIPPTFSSPSGNIYPLGTNSQGQDLFNQFIQSFVYDWLLGLFVGIAVIAIGVGASMVIGYIGGFVGSAFETLSLAIYLIPFLALLIALQSIFGGSFLNLIWIVTFVSWPFTAFTLIGVVRQIKSRTFVEAARISGSKVGGILGRHIVPNIAPLTLYLLSLSIGGAVGAVSTLQFLGLAPLNLSTWGGMLNSVLNNYYYVVRAPWWIVPPVVALTLFIVAFVFVSRGLDEVVNPRLRRR